MKYWFYIFSVIALLILQTAILPVLFRSWPTPNILLVASLLIILMHDREEHLYTALLCGLLLDFITPVPNGTYALLFVGAAAVMKFISRHWIDPGLNLKSLGLILFLATVVSPLTVALVTAGSLSLVYILELALLTLPTIFILSKLLYVRA